MVVNVEDISAVKIEIVTMPTSIHTTLYARASVDLGVLSPYLEMRRQE